MLEPSRIRSEPHRAYRAFLVFVGSPDERRTSHHIARATRSDPKEVARWSHRFRWRQRLADHEEFEAAVELRSIDLLRLRGLRAAEERAAAWKQLLWTPVNIATVLLESIIAKDSDVTIDDVAILMGHLRLISPMAKHVLGEIDPEKAKADCWDGLDAFYTARLMSVIGELATETSRGL
jgi:hypothetical protein